MARKKQSLLDDLGRLPWWVSVALAAAVFSALRWVVPWLFAADESESLAMQMFGPLASMVPSFAPFAAVLLLPAAVSAIRQWKDGQLLDSQGSGTPDLGLMDWKEFERLVGEYYRRKGYRVRPTPDGADGGVDLRLTSELGLHLVQCKHYGKRKVDVKIVRELYGVVAADGAYEGVLVTSGSFTAKARAFAEGKRIVLVDEPRLRAMIAEAQRTDADHQGDRHRTRTHEPGGRRPKQATQMDEEEALEVLGLDTTATKEDIGAAYRRLMQKVHPDKGGSDHFAKTLNQAWEVLRADR